MKLPEKPLCFWSPRVEEAYAFHDSCLVAGMPLCLINLKCMITTCSALGVLKVKNILVTVLRFIATSGLCCLSIF